MSLADVPRNGLTRREACLRASSAAAALARPTVDRLAEKTQPEPNSGCLLWLGAVGRNGYGKILHNGRARSAHRVAYEIARGSPPSAMVLHRCDTKLCVNPDHFFLGTHQDNMNDKVAKGRAGPSRLLSQEQISQMQRLRAEGALLSELAARFGISKAYACNLSRGRKLPKALPESQR